VILNRRRTVESTRKEMLLRKLRQLESERDELKRCLENEKGESKRLYLDQLASSVLVPESNPRGGWIGKLFSRWLEKRKAKRVDHLRKKLVEKLSWVQEDIVDCKINIAVAIADEFSAKKARLSSSKEQ